MKDCTGSSGGSDVLKIMVRFNGEIKYHNYIELYHNF